MPQLPRELTSLCDEIECDLDQWDIELPHFMDRLPGTPRPKRPVARAAFALRLMVQAEGVGGPEKYIGIEGKVAGLVVALRTEDFAALAEQVEREFAAVVEAAKTIDAFYKTRRRPFWSEDFGQSLTPAEIDGKTLLREVLPECREAISRFGQTLRCMHSPVVSQELPSPEAAAPAPVAPAPLPPELDGAAARVRVGGTWHDVTDEEKSMLSILFEAQGTWVGGPNIGHRPDKTWRRIKSEAVRNIIESDPAKGYRIPSLLPQ